jgi:hypothetical protein
MNQMQHPMKSTADISAWQLVTKLAVLAGLFMAYSYCFILTVHSIFK